MIAVYILAFLAGAALVLGVNLLYADIERERKRKLLERMKAEQQLLSRERAEVAMANRDLYELASGTGGLSHQQSMRERMGLFFEQSGVTVSPVQVGLAAIIAAGLAAGGSWLLTRSWTSTVIICLIGGALPVLYVVASRRRRLRRLQHQLPEAFDVISRMMQAGRTFPQAMQTAAKDGSPPLSQELRYCCDQQQLGMSPDAALRDLARRNGLLELKIFVLAVSIHRQTGGDLSSLLEKLADVIRGRVRMIDMISALTSETRTQAYVLMVLPIITLAAMSLIRPAYAQELYDRPELLVYCFVSILVGWIWMRRILNFSF